MKRKALKRILTICLATSLMAMSVPMTLFAKEGTEGMDAETEGTENLQDDLTGQEMEEDTDFHFTGPDTDIFAIDEKAMSDEEFSHLILSADERDVKAFLGLLSEEDKNVLLTRDTALTQPVDIYQTEEDGEATCEHFDTYLDYLASIVENAGYKYTNTTGNYYINWYNDTTSEGQSTIAVSGITKGDSDNTQQTDLTWKISNPKHDLTLKAGGKKTWPNSLKSAQAKSNYQQAWADFSYKKPKAYKATVTYDAANNGTGEYKMYQGTHDSETGCLKKNTTGTGVGYYIASGTLYTGSNTYTAETTETFNIGPNFSNLGCTDNAANNSTVARITLNPVYMTITWNQNGGAGSNCQPTSVLYGHTHAQATAPAKPGYTFAGWSGFNAANAITSNVTYTAAWNANQYTIVYNGAGGSLSKTSDKVTFGGSIPAMPSATKTGHKLTGWTWSGYSGSGAYSYVGNSTATAVWEALKYTIYYNANGGQVSPTSSGVTYGESCPTAPTPTRKGYTFTGWSGGTYTGTYLKAGDTTVTAGWKPNNYTVTFNTDGGSKVEDITAVYDTPFSLPEAPVKEDYEFVGWSDGTSIYEAGRPLINLTSEAGGKAAFKAEWIPATFIIHFDSMQGNEISDIKYTYGENTALPIPSRTDEQLDGIVKKYTFAGWEDEAGKHYTTAQDVTRDLIPKDGVLKLFAKWNVTESKENDNIRTETVYEEKTIIEKPINETNNYTNNYSMTDEQAQMFLEKLMQGIAAEIKIHGIRFEVIKNSDGTVTIRLIDLGNAKEVQIPDSIRIGDAVIPITIIDKGAFKGNTTIERLILGKNVTTIKESAFEGCTNLKQISFNEGLVTIEKRAFFGCTSLKEIVTPKTLKSIGESAFENCTSLSKVTLNEGLLDIGAKAFRGCKSITSITIPKSVLKIGNQAFENCIKLKTLKFASGSALQSIGKSAFAGCKALVSVKLPNKLTVLSDKAFYNCVKLKKVTGGKGLVTIGAKAFMNCKSLTKITLYTNVVKIGKQAFYGCRKLKKVTIKSKVLTKVGAKAFKKTHKKILFYVPDKAKKAAYKKLLKGKF
ncbi:MAG: leucine-rich repeat protein [Lachnospiraceae bacterium]|nr:leucine-rich repeat protein [Lachnospiraceae bacterium]